MPEFSETVQEKITLLKGLYRLGTSIQVFGLLKISWPGDPQWYGEMITDEVADSAPYDDDGPIYVDARIIPDSMPDWFLPIDIDSSIGDAEVDLEMWDADEVMSQTLIDYGEGVKAELFYWFPQGELLLPIYDGHVRNEDEASVDKLQLKLVQGIRSSDLNLPNRAHWFNCSAIFGGLFDTQEEIDAHDCPYNRQTGGMIGTLDPLTGLPWAYCDRQDINSCIVRGVNPLFHLSHRTIVATTRQTQHGGGALYLTSEQNETSLKDPVPVAMGTIRNRSMPVLAFLVPSIQEHGWFYALYEGCEGPIGNFRNVQITVAGKTQAAVPLHYNQRLGTKGQTPVGTDISQHGYSGTAHIRYNFGWVDTRQGEGDTPKTIDPSDASASAIIDGLNNIRIYSDADTYSESATNNRVWQITRALCDNRWGFGYDYAKFEIPVLIETADWADANVIFTDTFGTAWAHIRSESHVLLSAKKVQQQIEDMCMAGRLSRPFLFNGKIHIIPLRALTEDELDACPVFTDEPGENGEPPNIIWEDGKSTLTARKTHSDLDLINRVECTFDDAGNDWAETPLNPIEDVDAQLAAGRVVGDKSRKINSKKYPLLGVTNKSQAIKVGWSLLDLGPHDEGGLRNNCSTKFKAWFMDTLELHLDKVIKINSSRLTKYGFTYFRIKKMKREADLKVEVELQAYNETYMATFEEDLTPLQGQFLTVTGAGSQNVWGSYYYNGIINGHTNFDDDPYFIRNNGSRWELRRIDVEPYINQLLYRTTDNPADPWDGNWVVDGGIAPPPTVTEGVHPPDPPERPDFQPVAYLNGVLTIG